MAHHPSILVIGAGELGTAVLEALAKHPLGATAGRLAVLLRQATLDSAAPEKRRLTQELRAAGVHLEAADVATTPMAELATLLGRYDTVISCAGMGLPPGTQRRVTAAALEGGVRRLFPWQYGMDYDAIGRGSAQDLFDEQLAVREMLRAQDATKWTIVSTGLFMSFLFVGEFGVVDVGARVVRGLGAWDNRITLTVPDDIGRVTADLTLDPRELAQESGVVYCAGDTISYAELADLLDEHFQTTFRRELWDAEVLEKQRQEDPESSMVKYRATFAQGRGVAWDMDKTVNQERCIPMMDIKSYLSKVYPQNRVE